MGTVLIVGCGKLGSALGIQLHGDGHIVFGIRRNVSPIPEGIHRIEADLTKADSIPALPKEAESLVIILTADRFEETCYKATYVQGMRNFLAAIHRDGLQPKRVVFVSSTSVYGQSKEEWVDENAVTQPTTFSGERLLDAERLLFDSSLPVTVVRFAGMYGPERTHLLGEIRRGQSRIVEGGSRTMNLIHSDDVVGVLHHVLEMDDPADVYVGVDHEPVERNVLITWLAEQMGLPIPPSVDRADTVYTRVRSNKRCRNKRLIESGYSFKYPTYREGYSAVIGGTVNP